MSLAGDASGIYPCHVSPADMRRHPIGTGLFKFVEFKPNEDIKLTRNPDYWKPSRPYLDGIEYTIIKDPATANWAFIAGKFDITFPLFGLTIPLMKNIESQMPQVICELNSGDGGPSQPRQFAVTIEVRSWWLCGLRKAEPVEEHKESGVILDLTGRGRRLNNRAAILQSK
jgi:ABC-type transport system substrate-binding protein